MNCPATSSACGSASPTMARSSNTARRTHPIATVLIGVQMPRMNSTMERWIQTCRHELLDRTLIYNQAHLLHALREYETHYNTHRPHRGIAGASPLRSLPQPITEPATITQLRIHRHDRLGGLLHEYQHAA